jgi:pyrophosphatase PpaX
MASKDRTAAVEAVLFDLDGTLLDSFEQHWRSLAAALEDFGYEAPPVERIRELMGLPGLETVETVGVSEEEAHEVWQRWVEWGKRMSDIPEPFPGVMTMLEQLHEAGLRLGVVTSRQRATADHTPASNAIESRVEVFITRDDTDVGKPHPAPLYHALEKLEVTPERSIYVGDATYDIEAGERAGCLTVLTTWDAEVEIADGYEPDFVTGSVEELTEWLLALNTKERGESP